MEPSITAGKVRLLDADGQLLRWVSPEEAGRIIDGGRVAIRRTKQRIRALQYLNADRAKYTGDAPLHKAGMGEPHQRDNDTNVEGVWCIDRIPDRLRHEFCRVTDEITVVEEAA